MARKLQTPTIVGLAVGVGVTLLLGGGYLLGHHLAGDTLPRDASIAGVAVGGLSADAAEHTLRSELAAPAARTIRLSSGKNGVDLVPAEVGLAVDYAGSVAQAAGGANSWDPRTILTVLFGGSAQPAVLDLDPAALDAAIDVLAKKVDLAPVDARVVYDGLTPVRKGRSADGVAIDKAATAAAVTSAYLTSTKVDAVQSAVEPTVTTAEADAALTGVARTAVSGPVHVAVGKAGTLTIEPEQLAASLSFEAVDGALVPVLKTRALTERLETQLRELGLKPATDATITMGAKKPKILPSSDGEGVDPDDLGKAVVAVLSQKSSRSVTVAVSPLTASFTTADAKALGVKEVTGKFTTYFPDTAYRYNNIGKAAKLINGTFLKPGETFSMNQTLGERTRAAGWMSGGAIDGGKVVERLGGGISQATTTTFNAIYFAGLEDVYHKPHSLYFSRYPVGREATLDWASVDMKFRNDSPYGVVLQAWITGKPGQNGSVTVRVWSTKRYTIKSTTPVRSNYRAPGATVYDTSKGCIPQSAMSGFDVRFNRQFYQGKKLVRTEPFRWSYNSLTPVVCGKKPAKD